MPQGITIKRFLSIENKMILGKNQVINNENRNKHIRTCAEFSA